MAVTKAEKIFKGLVELGLQFGEDFCFGPVEALEVLDPFKVTHGDSTRVAEDVGDEENITSLLDDGVGWLGRGTVGGFREDFTFELRGTLFGDDPLKGGGNEDVAFAEEHFVRIDRFGSFEAGDAAGLLDVFAELV